MGKGEIACYEQFLLFPQCFQKASLAGASKGVIVWEWVKGFQDADCIENTCIVEKGKIAHLSNFTFFHNVFLKLFSSKC